MSEGVVSPPFGMSPVLPAFERATRMVTTLFGEVEASVVLVDQGQVWRSAGELVGSGRPAGGSTQVIESGKAMWVADRAERPDFDTGTLRKAGSPRFYAGAPVRLADGTTVGALRVVGWSPKPYDKRLAGCLQDLADGIG